MIENCLNKFITIDKKRNISVQLWNGNINLKEIKLVQKYVNNFIIGGSIEDFNLVVPWKNFYSGHVRVNVSNMDIYIDDDKNKIKYFNNKDSEKDINEKYEIKKRSTDKKANYIIKKLLERLVLEIERLSINYKKYRIGIENFSFGENEIRITGIYLERNEDSTYIRKIMPFDLAGNIVNNSVNLYVYNIDILFKRNDVLRVSHIVIDVIDVLRDIFKCSTDENIEDLADDVKSSESKYLNKDDTKFYDKSYGSKEEPVIEKISEELRNEKNKIIDLERGVKACLIIDQIYFKLIRERENGLKKMLKYNKVDLKLTHLDNTTLNFKVQSKTCKLSFDMCDGRIKVMIVAMKSTRIIKKLRYNLNYDRTYVLYCSEIVIENARVEVKNLVVKRRKKL